MRDMYYDGAAPKSLGATPSPSPFNMPNTEPVNVTPGAPGSRWFDPKPNPNPAAATPPAAKRMSGDEVKQANDKHSAYGGDVHVDIDEDNHVVNHLANGVDANHGNNHMDAKHEARQEVKLDKGYVPNYDV